MAHIPSHHSEVDVVVIGAGAAGIGAATEIRRAGRSLLVVEARRRLGGRGWTALHEGYPLDLGCGWLHSADKNPWVKIAQTLGIGIDRTPPPWDRQSFQQGLSEADQADFAEGFEAFDQRIERATLPPDRPAADFLDPVCRWNVLMDAVSTYFNGAALAEVSALDYKNFDDTDVNWRIPSGYGALMGTYGADLPVAFDCAVTAIDHSGLRLRIETTQGALAANQAVVTVPSTIIADQRIRFVPEIPEKIEAARKLPLGVVDKIFIACDQPEMFPKEGHFFGSVNRVDTGSYHLRPFGRPMIEVFFAGTVAETLERAGAGAGCAFAIEELVDLLGSDVRKRLRGLTASCWGADPFAGGSYSRAEVGCVGAREVLARSVDDRLFFAGEACSREGYSSAHGALSSGRDAARRLLGPQHSHIADAL